MAYTSAMAAALSGATGNQLRHWRHARTGPLLAPEISVAPRVLYSFRDLLALRTFVHLRQDASLQKIRVAISNLRDLGEVEHLASYQLVSDLRGNIQLIKGDEAAIDLAPPGADSAPSDHERRHRAVPCASRRSRAALAPTARSSVCRSRHSGRNSGHSGNTRPIRRGSQPDARDVPAEDVAKYYPAVTATAARDALDFAMYVDSYGRAA